MASLQAYAPSRLKCHGTERPGRMNEKRTLTVLVMRQTRRDSAWSVRPEADPGNRSRRTVELDGMRLEPKGVDQQPYEHFPAPVTRHLSQARKSFSGTGRSVLNLDRPILTEPAQASVLIWRRTTGRRQVTLAAR